MTDLPYTHTEPNGDSLRMFSDGPDLVATVRQGGGARTVVVPREETPSLARAVAAAGDTGHVVVEEGLVSWSLRSAEEEGALSMRERAAEVAYHDLSTENAEMADRIRALPLLPDSTEDALGPTHAEGAGSLSPCEISTWDVPASSDLGEVECVECLRALARDRDRYRTAWESARRGRAQARAQVDDARRWGRILEAQRKDLRQELRTAREVTGRLPEDDMVEPGDEVPALDRRVTDLEQQYTDLANLVHGHGEDLARLRCRFTEEDDG